MQSPCALFAMSRGTYLYAVIYRTRAYMHILLCFVN